MARVSKKVSAAQREAENAPHRIWKTAIYARLSDFDDVLRDTESLEVQISYIKEYINHRDDLMLLDVSLPDGSGFSVCAAARHTAPALPVIFLTASDDELSVVTGLDMGAEDYIAKPFRPLELLSRIRTALRRKGKAAAPLRLLDVTVDPGRGRVEKAGREIVLSALEYKLLMLFLTHPGTVLSRDVLLSELWDAGGDYVTDNTLTVYIKRLREKLEDDPQNPRLIKTVRGLGYKAGD